MISLDEILTKVRAANRATESYLEALCYVAPELWPEGAQYAGEAFYWKWPNGKMAAIWSLSGALPSVSLYDHEGKSTVSGLYGEAEGAHKAMVVLPFIRRHLVGNR